MAYKAPVDRKTQERTKAGWQSLLWMFVGAILAVMIGVFLYLSPLFDGFRKEVEVNAPVEVAPLPQNTEKSNDYEFYEILPQRKFQGSDSGLGETPDPEIPEVEPRRKKEVDVVVTVPKNAKEEITVVEEDATYDDAPTEKPKPDTETATATDEGANTGGDIKVSRSNSTYILQIRSYDNADDADKKLAEVMMAGVEARVVQRRDASGVELYQVLSQPMSSKAAALAAEQKLSSYGIDAIVVEQRR